METLYTEMCLEPDYKIDLKNPVRKLNVWDVYQEKNPDARWKKTLFGGAYVSTMGRGDFWIEAASWIDGREGEVAPDKIWVIVHTNGASWYANKCFSSAELAEAEAVKMCSQYQHAWAVLANRK